jgi:hypothetical protein
MHDSSTCWLFVFLRNDRLLQAVDANFDELVSVAIKKVNKLANLVYD